MFFRHHFGFITGQHSVQWRASRSSVLLPFVLIFIGSSWLPLGCGSDDGDRSTATAEPAVELQPVPGYEDYPEEIQQARREFEWSLRNGIDKKITLLTELLRLYQDLPFQDEILSVLATSLNIRNKTDEAARLYTRISNEYPKGPYAYDAVNYLREVARTKNDHAKLAELSEKLLVIGERIVKEDPHRALDMGFLNIECLLDLNRPHDAKKVAQDLHASIRSEQANQERPDRLAEFKAYSYLIRINEQVGDFGEALRCAKAALRVRADEDRRGGMTIERPETKGFDDLVADVAYRWAESGPEGVAGLKKLHEEIDLLSLVRNSEARDRLVKVLAGS